MYLLYLDGNAKAEGGNGFILGYAVYGSSIVMFPERIEDLRGGILAPLLAEPEDVVIQHEAGHLLGLVNNGIDMVEPHQDTEHGNHDDSDRCIMFWGVEGEGLGDILQRRQPTFDDACLADMEAAGGRPASESRPALP